MMGTTSVSHLEEARQLNNTVRRKFASFMQEEWDDKINELAPTNNESETLMHGYQVQLTTWEAWLGQEVCVMLVL